MTRFARGLGSKGANERAPEQATSWSEMRNQLKDKQKRQADRSESDKFEAMRKQNYENFLKEEKEKAIAETWCEFDTSSKSESSKLSKDDLAKKQKGEPGKNKKVASGSELDEDDWKLDKWCNEYSDEESTAKLKSLTSQLENILSKKQKKKEKQKEGDGTVRMENEEPTESDSKKKNKKKAKHIENKSLDKKIKKKENNNTTVEYEKTESEPEVDFEITDDKPKKKSNKNKTILDETTEPIKKDSGVLGDSSEKPKKKKNNKNKPILDEKSELVVNVNGVLEDSSEKPKKKKKNKMPPSLDETSELVKKDNGVLEISSKKPKKKKKNNKTNETETVMSSETLENGESHMEPKLNQKRKATNPDFDINEPKNKKKKKKESYNGQDEKTTNNQTPSVKTNKKDLSAPQGRRKPLNEEKTIIIVNGEELEVTMFGGFPILDKDAERLKELRKNLISKGIPRSEVDRTLKLERRKAEKSLARLKKKLCFHCRKAGHNLSECPELNSKTDDTGMPTSGICFKCGSTEHTHFACRVVKTQDFKFAQCYICKEQGHISRQCPDNPRGMYPKGGACRECGDVTHLKKDCPKILQLREDHTIKLDTMEDGNIEDISNKTASVKINTPKVKRVQF